MSLRSILGACLLCAQLHAEEMPAGAAVRRRVWQPVHEYFGINGPQAAPVHGRMVLNSFLNYTHLGSDFGFLGPAESHCTCAAGSICAEMPAGKDGWGGLWHSLNGLASAAHPLNFEACYPHFINTEHQPRIIGLRTVVSGRGTLKLEVKSASAAGARGAEQRCVWTRTHEVVAGANTTVFTDDIKPSVVGSAQFLNWVAEPGSDICVDSIALEVELPPVDFPAYAFLASYAKLARCYSEETCLVRDRAHTGPEDMNALPATGMFALGTAAAAKLGMVDESFARSTLQCIARAVESLPRRRGLLPHFVHRQDARWEPLPGSEYSTVDTALCCLALRQAAAVMQNSEVAEAALRLMQAIDFTHLRDGDGYVIHGIRDDGRPLPGTWRDWGGETTLVLMLQHVACGTRLTPKMDQIGRTHRGIGFISELPSLFFDQFNSGKPGAIANVNWQAYRAGRLRQQKAYFPTHSPESIVARQGIYGLSAGEGRHGVGYHVAGVDDSDQSLAFPHYILMSGMIEESPQKVYDVLTRLEEKGWFPPWGLVENIHAEDGEYVPMLGALNASFECLAAYHLLMKLRGSPDALYQAARSDTVLSDAIRVIYPD